MIDKNNPIRILQVFATMDKGGAETMIMNYYRKIDRSKIQFDFLIHTEDECAYDKEIENLGGKIYRLPRYSLRNHFTYQKLWKSFLTKHPEYQIIHGHFFTISAIYFQVAKKLNRIRIAHSHISNVLNDSIVGKIKYNFYIKPIKKRANYYLACSLDAGEWMYGKNFSTIPNAHILRNAIDIKQFTFDDAVRSQIRKNLSLENKFVVGHIGRFFNQKNHMFLIDIFVKIKEKRSDAVLLLVGDGVLKEDIKMKIENLNLNDSVIFAGVREDIPDLLQAMDVFVFPSKYEGLGIVLIEAQTTGLPCFTSKKVVPLEVKVTDLLTFIDLKNNAEHWSDIILENSHYDRFSRNQEVQQNGYDIHSNVDWLEDFYLHLAHH